MRRTQFVHVPLGDAEFSAVLLTSFLQQWRAASLLHCYLWGKTLLSNMLSGRRVVEVKQSYFLHLRVALINAAVCDVWLVSFVTAESCSANVSL